MIDPVVAQSFVFPKSYAPWLAARFQKQVRESLATCASCAMVQPQGLTRDPGPFVAHLKCCTYFPFVPNFSLGSMLQENPGVATLRLKVAAKQGLLLPTGLHASSERQQLATDLAPHGFGRKSELLCPFFDTQSLSCSVWSQRPGVCTSYFCKSDRGADGLKFWSDMEDYLNHFEWVLANEVFRRLGLGEDDREMCKAALSIEEAGEERDYFVRAAWSQWFDRQNEFYLEAQRCAQHITPPDLDALLGSAFLAKEDSLRQRLP